MLTAIGCFLAYWIIWSATPDSSLTGTCVKAGATGGFAIALLFGGSVGHAFMPLGSFLGLMGLGLAFGALGDFALARAGDRAFLTGMAAFALGHLIYAYALWRRTQNIIAMELPYDNGATFAGAAITAHQITALIVLAVLLASTEVWLAPHTAHLRWPVRGYVLVIGAMAASVIFLLPNGGTALLRLGAALFVLSDILLALKLFRVTTPQARAALSLTLWPAYWLGQVLLMVGAVLYEMFPKG